MATVRHRWEHGNAPSGASTPPSPLRHRLATGRGRATHYGTPAWRPAGSSPLPVDSETVLTNPWIYQSPHWLIDWSTTAHRQDLLACPPQQDGAGFGVFALSDEGEVLISDLLHLKQPSSNAHVLLTQLVRPTHNPGAARPERETVIYSSLKLPVWGAERWLAAAYLAMRLLSVFLTRRMAVMLAFTR